MTTLLKKLDVIKEKIAELKKRPTDSILEEISLYSDKVVKNATEVIRKHYSKQDLLNKNLHDLLGLSSLLDYQSYTLFVLYLCSQTDVTIDDLPF